MGGKGRKRGKNKRERLRITVGVLEGSPLEIGTSKVNQNLFPFASGGGSFGFSFSFVTGLLLYVANI